MLKVYVADCSPLLSPQELARALPYIDPLRQEKIRRLVTAEKKAQSACAGLLLNHLFGDTSYESGANGKPHLTAEGGVHFNLSHSGQYVVCAVSDTDVGVDIESVSPIRAAVMRRCFHEEEQQWIGDDASRFTRLWTMKEAYMKLLGTGFSLPPKDISLTVPPKNGYDSALNCHWQLLEWDYPITVCCGAGESCEVIHINIKDLL